MNYGKYICVFLRYQTCACDSLQVLGAYSMSGANLYRSKPCGAECTPSKEGYIPLRLCVRVVDHGDGTKRCHCSSMPAMAVCFALGTVDAGKCRSLRCNLRRSAVAAVLFESFTTKKVYCLMPALLGS